MTKLNVNFNYNAWNEYLEWKKEDKKTSQKIDNFIKECQRHPFTGKGKPEPLKANLSGAWSRQINQLVTCTLVTHVLHFLTIYSPVITRVLWY